VVWLEAEDSDTYVNRGEAYRLLGQYDKAVRDFCRAIRLDSSNDVAAAGLKLAKEQMASID